MKKNTALIVAIGGIFLLMMYSLPLISAVASCSDSDGDNPYTKGRVTGTYSNNAQFSVDDFCNSDNTKVSEQICISTSPSSKFVSCPAGCSNGKCNTQQSCSDSDGKDYKIKGYVDTTYNGASNRDYDSCQSGDGLNERYCTNNWIATETISCSAKYGSGYRCDDGKCMIDTSSCSDSDGHNYLTKGNAITVFNGHSENNYDSCVDETVLRETYCTNNWVAGENIDCKSKYGNNYFCSDGKCAQHQISCSDTDGKNWKTKGIVTTVYDGTSVQNPDSCTSETGVKETYCTNNWIANEEGDCKITYGAGWSCLDGRCFNNISQDCNLKTCDACGDGIINICDKVECESCGEKLGCVFNPNVIGIGGSCVSKWKGCESCWGWLTSKFAKEDTGKCTDEVVFGDTWYAKMLGMQITHATWCPIVFVFWGSIGIIVIFVIIFIIKAISRKGGKR